jgi:hypothetical protein
VERSTHHYFYSGLRVTSEILIPEWDRFKQESPWAGPEISIVQGALLGDTEVPGTAGAVTDSDLYRLFVPEVGSYTVRNGNEILVRPVAGAADNNLRLYLLGSAWGAVCYQRGLFVLHGSAVAVGSAAVAFCAHSGMGKSTTAAWLASRGFPLVSDDLCRVDISTQHKPILYPSVQRLKLWSESLGALGWDSQTFQRDHTRHEKFHVPWSGLSQTDPLPLHAIYLLDWGELGIRRLTGRVALQRFLSAATYRGNLLEPMGQWPSYCARSIKLLQQAPAWEFSRSREFAEMGSSIELLLAHWKESGLSFQER